MIRYTILRLLVFFGFLLALWLFFDLTGLGLHPIWLVIFAGLFSMVTSFFLLQGPRAEMSRTIESKVEQRQAKLAEQRTDEEEEDDLT